MAVVVCTARIALDAVIHAYLKLEETNLIIFDEAHHALGGNEYARLMAHYRLISQNAQPKIFGMTASPLSSKGTLESASINLEDTLNARIFTAAHSTRAELQAAVSKPEELVLEYDQPQKPFVDPLGPPAVQAEVVRRMPPSAELDKIVQRMSFYWEEYGSVFSDLAWMTSSKELRQRAARKSFFARQKAHESMINPDLQAAKEKLEIAASVSRQIISILDTIPPIGTVALNEDNASPKLRKVIQALECFRDHADHFCGILFCSRRLTALALTLLISRTPSLSFLHPEALVGHGGKGDITHSDGMSWEEQKAILSRLRNRDPTNLVIATSVLEEGLDIAPVNCVIRFDLPQHHIGYVQSKGRARAAHSTFILLAEKDNEEHLVLLERFAYAEDTMKDFLESLPEDRVARSVVEDADEIEAARFDPDNQLASKSLVDETTGARLWPVDATVVLADYVSLLKSDDFCPGGPDYEYVGDDHAWSVVVRLPASSPGGTVSGPVMSSKISAKRAAAFEVCCLLHRLGELDHHLAPRRERKAPVEPQARLVGDFSEVGIKVDWAPENMLSFKPAIPDVFSRPAIPETGDQLKVFWHVFHLPSTDCVGDQMRPVALVTRRPLPAGLPGVVLTEYREQNNVEAKPMGEAHEITLSEDQLKLARSYNFRLWQLVTHRTLIFDELPYLILPLVRDCSTIDWDEVEQAEEPLVRFPDQDPESWKNFDDQLLFDGKDYASGACPYRGRFVDTEQTPLSPYCGRDGTAGTESYIDHWISKRAGKRRTYKSEVLNKQPMLVVRRLSRRLENFLTIAKKRAISEVRDSYLIPEFTWAYGIRASMFESASLLPSMLTGLQQMLLGHEVNMSTLDGLVDPRQMVVALTHSLAQFPFSLERFEFLGDVFLKAASSALVYSLFQDCPEGDLHWERREMVNNMNLIAKTKHLDLGSKICTFTYTRRTWRPPLCQIKERPIDPKEELQHLGYKAIADVVESILGAAIMTDSDLDDPDRDPDGLWQNVHVGLRALGCFNIIPRELCTIASIAEVWEQSVAVKAVAERWDDRLHLESLRRFQAVIGYEFKHPHLALEALTHPGHLRSVLPSYQRLEFLGDALLDFCVDSWLFSTYRGLHEGELTSLKDVAVANKTLCALCEHLRLYKFLQMDYHGGFAEALSNLIDDMEVARNAVDRHFEWPTLAGERYDVEPLEGNADVGGEQDATESGPEAGASPYRHYWAKKKEIKALADIVESTLGAVFVDSGFNFETVWRFWRRLYLPWYSRYADYDALLEARDRGVAIRQRPNMAPACHPPHQLQFGKSGAEGWPHKHQKRIFVPRCTRS